MKTVCIIPARYKSSRFPGKPLADICGKPMIWWVYKQCMKVTAFTDIIVATDDNRILDNCKKLHLNCVLTSENNLTGTDRVAEVAANIEADLFVNVQGDEPLIKPQIIEKVITPFRNSKTKFDVVNLMSPIHDISEINNPSVVKVITKENNVGLFLTRAPAPYPKGNSAFLYYKQLGIYAFSRDALDFFRNYGLTHGKSKIERIEDVEILRFIENDWSVQYVETESTSYAVDTPQDLAKVIEVIKSTDEFRSYIYD